ncbi:CdaR family protein [Clostridium aestuarii]|uniref:CdaR family protein n=1 Tax=Clostridium aestuarii TaxID=338193 RepID=A0ABT4CWU8_9CLOT|nr:CdaR family protein [Clostridium aestuarii]MCY6483444.1 CdaR family protein [Clostridium aestuarii]
MVQKSRQQLMIKIGCVIAAFIMWLYTSNDINMNKTRRISNIPVEFVNEDLLIQSGFVLSPGQKFATSLKITGKATDVYAVSSEQFKIVADMSVYALKKGENKIPISIMKRPNKNINIINDDTMWISVKVDNFVQKVVSVDVEVKGSSKDGFYKATPIVNPTTVIISGAEQSINSIDKVLAEVDMNNSDKNLELSVPVKAIDKARREVNEIKIEPKIVNVVVPVQKTKEVGINIRTEGELTKEFILKSINPVKNKVVITGDPKGLVKIDKLDTAFIDLSSIKSEKTNIKLKVIIPEGIKIISGEGTIDTQIILDKVIQKNISLDIEYQNLNEIFDVEFNKESLSLVVSGGKTLIDSLISDDIKCFVELDSLDEGEYTIPISVVLPSGVTKISQNINFVKVKITKKQISKKDKEKEKQPNTELKQEQDVNSKPVNN